MTIMSFQGGGGVGIRGGHTTTMTTRTYMTPKRPVHTERVTLGLCLRDAVRKMETTVTNEGIHTWCSSTAQCK